MLSDSFISDLRKVLFFDDHVSTRVITLIHKLGVNSMSELREALLAGEHLRVKGHRPGPATLHRACEITGLNAETLPGVPKSYKEIRWAKIPAWIQRTEKKIKSLNRKLNVYKRELERCKRAKESSKSTQSQRF